MDFERVQQAWQKQVDVEDITFAVQLKLGSRQLDIRCADPGPEGETPVEKVMRRSRRLDRWIWWSDVRESIVSIIMAVLIIGGNVAMGWNSVFFYLAAVCCLWVAAFIVVDRRLQGRPQPAPPVREGLEAQLRRVNHQIWMYRNIWLWYLLPLLLVVILIIAGLTQLSSWSNANPGLIGTVVIAVVFISVWALNQDVVKKLLVPQKNSLESVLRDLDSETQ